MYHACLAAGFQKIIATLIWTQLQENRIFSDFHCYKSSAYHKELKDYLLNGWFHLSHGIDRFILILHFQNYLSEFDVTWIFICKYTNSAFNLMLSTYNTIQKISIYYFTDETIFTDYLRMEELWSETSRKCRSKWTWLLASTLLENLLHVAQVNSVKPSSQKHGEGFAQSYRALGSQQATIICRTYLSVRPGTMAEMKVRVTCQSYLALLFFFRAGRKLTIWFSNLLVAFSTQKSLLKTNRDWLRTFYFLRVDSFYFFLETLNVVILFLS